MSRDDIYALPRDRVGQFAFDDSVAEVFPDMISRSVPGYGSILSVIEQLSQRYTRPHTHVYDLGCSLGAATWLIRRHAPDSVVIHAVDNSQAMIRRLRARLERDEEKTNVGAASIQTHLADVTEFPMSNASMVVLNFTLQFVPAEQRVKLLQRAFDALVDGGALVLSEKISSDQPAEQALLAELHLDFKRACGYSELEIAQKRTALENTLISETMDMHVRRLHSVGFGVVVPWFQCFNFASILAVKVVPAGKEPAGKETA
jgi:tRNA (cmo5U34)-methyltransferase